VLCPEPCQLKAGLIHLRDTRLQMPELTLSSVSPQIPTRAVEAPAGSSWIHEIKHDGFCTLIVKESLRVRALTRNGHDWTNRYAPIVQFCKGPFLPVGGVVIQDENGVSDFDALPWAIRHEPHRLVFFAFDLLFLSGEEP
jgi:bifunctional non-homologous end joining protein LigD